MALVLMDVAGIKKSRIGGTIYLEEEFVDQ